MVLDEDLPVGADLVLGAGGEGEIVQARALEPRGDLARPVQERRRGEIEADEDEAEARLEADVAQAGPFFERKPRARGAVRAPVETKAEAVIGARDADGIEAAGARLEEGRAPVDAAVEERVERAVLAPHAHRPVAEDLGSGEGAGAIELALVGDGYVARPEEGAVELEEARFGVGGARELSFSGAHCEGATGLLGCPPWRTNSYSKCRISGVSTRRTKRS